MKRIAVLCLSLFTILLARAATPTNLPPRKLQLPPGDRFLFVVDTSSGMAKFASGSRQIVFDLIYSGLNGHMRPGDSYGLWTFNEEVHSGKFPIQVWQTNALDLASAAGRYLREHPAEKKPRLELALDKLKVVVNTVKDLTAFVITDGRTPFEGTPFDEALNASARNRADEARKTRKPLIVTLVARGGDFIGWSVTMPGENIPMPEHSPLPVMAQTPTNRPSSTVASVAARPTAAPIIITKRPRPEPIPAPASSAESTSAASTPPAPDPSPISPAPAPAAPSPLVEPSREPVAPAAPTSGLAAITLPLNFAPTAAPPVTLRPKNASVAAVDAAPPPVPAPLPPALPSGTNLSQLAQAPLAASPGLRLLTTMTVSAREPTSAPTANPEAESGLLAVTPAPVPQVHGADPLVMLAIGATLLVAAMVLTVLFIHNLRQPRRASFISQSIDRNRGPSEEP